MVGGERERCCAVHRSGSSHFFNRIEIKSNIERWLLTIIAQREIQWALEKRNKSVTRNRCDALHWETSSLLLRSASSQQLPTATTTENHNTLQNTENYSKNDKTLTNSHRKMTTNRRLSLKILFFTLLNCIIHSAMLFSSRSYYSVSPGN